MGFVLAIIARIIFTIVGIVNPVIVAIKYRNKHAFWKVQSTYWKIDATELDKYGNYAYRSTWNLLLQRKGYNFGNKNETISTALGKNKEKGTLTKLGKLLCFILGVFDKNHCEKAAKK